MPIGWHFVLSHFGAIITGSFSTKSRMISKDAPPEPIMIAALSDVKGTLEVPSTSSVFCLDFRWSDNSVSLLMHNRVRMLVASFLCKHLLIDWKWGEAYFAEKLLDYDLSANNGNWQWAAGTGVDAAPYFRVFNPITQVDKFDKGLVYIRKWVKDFDELSYPQQMVDHKNARERALSTYKEALNN